MSSKKQLKRLSQGFEIPQNIPRTEVPEEAIDEFLDPKKQTTKKTNQKARTRSQKSSPQGSRLRREESGERLAVYLPPELAEQLRIRCAVDRRSLSDAVTEAVARWLR